MAEFLELLVQQLSDSSREQRKKAARRLLDVATALGPEAVQEKLIPFLCRDVDDDDEVLLIIAQQLGKIASTVFAGQQPGAECLLQPLESLCSVDETVVREAAVESSCAVVAALPDGAIPDSVVRMVMDLANGDWFTKKVSACGLVACTYARANPEGEQQLLNTFVSSLCVDDAPMVRRAAAKQLGAVAKCVGVNYVLAKIVPAYEKLCVKDTDSVRTLAIAETATIASLLDDNMRQQVLLKIVTLCCEDRSWRVRSAMTQQLGTIAKGSEGSSFAGESIVPLLLPLIFDPEPDVREAAVQQMPSICVAIGADAFQQKCLATLDRLGTEEEEIKVRTALADVIMQLIPHLGETTTQTHLLPLITRSLESRLDEESEGLQHMSQALINMKLKIFSRMESLMSTLSPESARHFCDNVLLTVVDRCTITEHHEDSNGGLIALYGADQYNWRAREATIKIVPAAAQTLLRAAGAGKEQDPLDKHSGMFAQYVAGLNDPVAAVRNASADSMGNIVAIAGAEWFQSNIVPILDQHMGERTISLEDPRPQPNGNPGKYLRGSGQYDDGQDVLEPARWTKLPSGGYLRRIAVMRTMGSLGEHSDLMPVAARYLGMGLQATEVVNVQIAALKSVLKLLPALGQMDDIVNAIQALATNADDDVREYANDVLERLS